MPQWRSVLSCLKKLNTTSSCHDVILTLMKSPFIWKCNLEVEYECQPYQMLVNKKVVK